MTWQQSASSKFFTLQMGACVASVWHLGPNRWAARVGGASGLDVMKDFAILQDAQAWCITELAALRRAGQCDEVKRSDDST